MRAEFQKTGMKGYARIVFTDDENDKFISVTPSYPIINLKNGAARSFQIELSEAEFVKKRAEARVERAQMYLDAIAAMRIPLDETKHDGPTNPEGVSPETLVGNRTDRETGEGSKVGGSETSN